MRRYTSRSRSDARVFIALCLIGSLWCLSVCAPHRAFAQSAASGSGNGGSSTTGQAAGRERIEPVFPTENQNLIFVEGEDAVVTNFDKQPIFNYSASGLRTLQLSTTSDPNDNFGYYADYVFYVDRPGTYELWYGGTPPGPYGTSEPSYTSPFEYVLDGESPVQVYANDVSVGKSYTPSFYWNQVGRVNLSAGRHQLQFRVTEKRKYDNRYFFYLDCFFLVRVQNGVPVSEQPLPELFPSSLKGGTTGLPYKFIEDYLIEIRDHPANVQAYIDLSLDYALVGDNLSALKYLNRAGELDPNNETVSLLKAKNLLWKGDTANGLSAYRDLLNKDPSNVNLWAEAGKVAAWSGRYSDSISFFTDGLKHFPNNLTLLVNLGLTYLWSGDEQKAQSLLLHAREAASSDYGRLMQLARTLTIAQAYSRAVDVYDAAIREYPKNLEGYLSLEKLLMDTGKAADAEKVRKQMSDTFVQSDRLSQFLQLSQTKQKLKSRLISNYEAELAKQPDNLALREILARAYFWNGLREKGTAEYLNILANYTYRKLRGSEDSSLDLVTLLDRSYVFARYYRSVDEEVRQLKKELTDSLSAYRAAAKVLTEYQDKVDAARQKGQTPPAAPSGTDPQANVRQTEQAVAQALSKAQGFLERFSQAGIELKNDENSLKPIAEQEKKEHTAFQKVIDSSKWHWRESDTLAELSKVQDSGAALASYSIGKIDQIEGQLSSAADIFNKNLGQEGAPFRYQLSQTLLWMGNPARATAELKKLPADSQETHNAFPWLDLASTLSQALSATGFSPGVPDEKLVQDVLLRLDSTSAEAKQETNAIAVDQSTMHGILRDRLIRAIYQNQEETFQLRKDLGDYYLTERKFEDAIRQFRQVLAIDPWNIGALFRIGQVYKSKGNWKQALANFEKVYYSDPTYENVAHQYNDLARQHPDSLSFDAWTMTDSQHLSFRGSAEYSTPIDSTFGLDIRYAVNTQRLFAMQIDQTVPPPTPPYPSEAPNSYQTNTVTLGVPINLYGIKLKITPRIGGTVANRLDNATTSNLAVLNLGNLVVDPVVVVDGELSLGRYVYLTGNYTLERYAETYGPYLLASAGILSPPVTSVFDNSGEMNLSVNLGFLGGFPFKNSSIRSYGRVDFLSDSNLIYTVLEELNLNLLTIPKTATSISLIGSAQLQNSTRSAQPTYLYYAPMGELLAGGGVQGSTWLPVGGDTIGLSIRTIASYYGQKIFSLSDLINLYQLTGEGRIEYDRGNGAVYLDASLSATNQYQPAANPRWNYWSMTISLGYSAQLPTLLAP